LISIKLKFRFSLTKTRLFVNSWNEKMPPTRVLVLIERNARADALLKLIELVQSDPDVKRQFRIDAAVRIFEIRLLITNF
jgi:hypothetical protein